MLPYVQSIQKLCNLMESVLEQKWLENHDIYYIGATELPFRFPRCAPPGTIKDKSKIFLNFVNNGDFDVTEELLPCLKSSRNSALNKP